LEKIEEMLLEISLRKAARETAPVPEASSSNISSSINKACAINHDKGKNVLNVLKHSENESEKSEKSSSSESDSSTDEDIKILEQNFGKIDISPKIQRIFKSKPVNLTKSWYNKPTPPNLQFEERVFQNQFSVSVDKLYEWNIDGLSEQEILNKMNHMSMVANAYMTNHDISDYDIFELLTTGFSGTLNAWWDKHLSQDAKTRIKTAVKTNDDGTPVLNDGKQLPDGVNTLIYTIVKHFVGTPSNITSRISDYLNNLRCPTMSDYRWYQDVFISRVMLRTDSFKPYWKEKFIDGLPSLFAHKVKDELVNPTTGSIDYENLTYGDLFSIIKKLGIKMCVDQKMIRQQLKNAKKAKYEMGNFCEQFGLPPIAPSRRHRKKPDRFTKKYRHTKRRTIKPERPNKIFRKHKRSKPVKSSKGRCFNCGKKGHYADKCPNTPNKLKNKINSLKIDEDDRNDLFRILQSQDYSDSDSSYINEAITSDDSCYHSASESSSKDVFKIGCSKSCCESKFCNVTSKEEEQENLLITLISKIENDELKDEYLKKLKKTMKHDFGKSVKTKISLDETLERFSKQKSKAITVSDLQHEISNIKKDIVDLKNDMQHIKTDNQDLKSQLLITNLHKKFQIENEDLKIEDIIGNQHEHSNDPPESSNATVCSSSDLKFVKLIKSFIPPKWYAKITVIVAKDYSFDAIALIDSGSDMNCIQEGLVSSNILRNLLKG